MTNINMPNQTSTLLKKVYERNNPAITPIATKKSFILFSFSPSRYRS